MAAPLVLLNAEATKFCACDAFPELAVAVPVAAEFSRPCRLVDPLMSSAAIGVVVLIPIFAVPPEPDWNSTELARFDADVHRGTKLAVPDPVTVAGESALAFELISLDA